jgi:hypothetical protein
MADDLVVSEGVLQADGPNGITGIKFGTGTSAVSMTLQPGTINSLISTGQILSVHDALYVFASDMTSNGTAVDMDGAASQGMPRWSLADGATQRVKWTFEIPAEWDTVAFRFYWAKVSAGAQAVTFAFRYHLFYPFAVDDLDTGAMTEIALAGTGTSMSVANRPAYEIPTATSAIAIADGAFGSKPFMLCELERDGTGDAYAGAVTIAGATLTRTS